MQRQIKSYFDFAAFAASELVLRISGVERDLHSRFYFLTSMAVVWLCFFMVTFKEVTVGGKVGAYFKGSIKSEVEQAAMDYMAEYPFGAYLTEVEKKGENIDGGYYIHIWRRARND